MVKTDNTVNSVIEIIPTEILNLLWFSDGNLKNYDKEKRTVSEIKSGNFTFTLQISGSEDPSAISFELPIGVPLDPAPKLGYFPSYANMTPDERATYLYWLTNIDKLPFRQESCLRTRGNNRVLVRDLKVHQ